MLVFFGKKLELVSLVEPKDRLLVISVHSNDPAPSAILSHKKRLQEINHVRANILALDLLSYGQTSNLNGWPFSIR